MIRADRRGERTRELLQQALIGLLRERRYQGITIRDIVERANVGYTTFYLHYRSKDDLFMSCHEAIVAEFHFGPLQALSRAEMLSPETPPGLIAAYQHLAAAQALLYPIFQGRDSLPILRRIRDRNAQGIAAGLHVAFAEADGTMPLDVLAIALAGAQLALVQWWLEQRQLYSPEIMAQTFHRLQRATIRDALGLDDGEETRVE